LEIPSGVPADAVSLLRPILAASLIQQTPGLLPITPDPAVDPPLNEAAAAGATLAANLTQSGTRVRVVRDSYVTPASTLDRPKRIFGPFVDTDGNLIQFAVFESVRFLRVFLRVPSSLPVLRNWQCCCP
jgi:hypothetical protein